MSATDRVGSGVSAEEKISALESALQSETFGRAGRLRDLLRFLCEAEIEGRESELTEHTIGTVALGRGKDFSPLEDSSVRSRTYELRQKLEKYYADEAPFSHLRIELRKGTYVPRFLSRQGDVKPPGPVQIVTTLIEEPTSVAANEETVVVEPLVRVPPPSARQPRFLVWMALTFLAGAATVAAVPWVYGKIQAMNGSGVVSMNPPQPMAGHPSSKRSGNRLWASIRQRWSWWRPGSSSEWVH